ncbi:hypothetical protein C2G38_2041733 [Gigaspora rosea]|uniref:Uncharacterized protein n=1 Tax=Gigaspora rosea TaxID=44941 RepID=A0A397UT75_9GLOM|nr:hypothetical protein C2G38_2041733 [Gigaspora rosea]
MKNNKPIKSSGKLSSSSVDSEDLIFSEGLHGPFLACDSFANCYCDQCNGRHIKLYTCVTCKANCPPHIRKCSKCADQYYSSRHKINRKYYESRKSRLNSEDPISSEESLINKTSNFVVCKDLPAIWNNAWSKYLDQHP